MSLFGALMGDLDNDPIFGQMNRSMRQMNNLMSSLMGPDPFSMLSPFDNMGMQRSALTGVGGRSSSLMPFGFQSMPNINSLLNGDLIDAGNGGSSYCSSSFVSMTSGPDGRPQVYQATSSTKSGPGGIKETHKTEQDSRTGVKKMAIGHHIYDRAHIIEKEQNVRSGQMEERQDFINLDEEEAEEFDREFTTKARSAYGIGPSITPADRSSPAPLRYGRQNLQALPAPPVSSTNTSESTATTTNTIANATTTPSVRRLNRNALISKATPRRQLRTPSSSPLASQNPSLSTSVHPYNNSPGIRRHRQKHHSSKNH